MNIRITIILVIVTMAVAQCSTTRVTNTGSGKFIAIPDTGKLFIITPAEMPPINSVEVGTFEHVEDWNGNWDLLMDKIQKKARDNGANIIKIDEYFEGSKTKGHALLIRGKFYLSQLPAADIEAQVLKERTKNVAECNCSYLKVFRDEGNAALRALVKIDLVVNDSLFGPLPNKKAYTIRLTKESDVFIGAGKSSNFLVKNNFGKEYYVQATKAMASPAPGTVIIGPKVFILLETLQAKVHFETIEKTYR